MEKQKTAYPHSFFEHRRRLIMIIIAIGIIVRVAVLQQWNMSVFNLAVWSDAATYNQWARSIVTTGDWIGTRPFFMTPLYPYLLAVIYSVVGESLNAVRYVQHFLGLVTVLLIFLSVEKLFHRRIAFFAALFASLYGPLILHANVVLVETVKVFLLMLAFYSLLIAKERGTFRMWFVSGLILGLTVLCRPTDLMVVGVVILWIVSLPVYSMWERFRMSFAVTAAVVLIVLPVTIRNYSVSKEFIPITSNGGLNFYLGNNAKAVGVYYNVDGLDLANDPDGRVFLETAFGKPFSAGEASSYWMKEALDFIVHHPFDAAVLLAKKTLLFFHFKEIGQLGYNYRFISMNAVPLFGYLLTFAVLFPVAMVGLIALRKEWKKYFLLYGFLAAEFLSVILFFVTDRFRLSAVPFFIFFAGYGIDLMLKHWMHRRRTAIIAAGGLMAVSLAVATILNVPIEDEFSTEHEYIGMNYFDLKQYEPALFEYRQAIRYKESFHIHNNIGNVYAAVGNIPAAMNEYQRGWELNTRQAISVFSMGTAYVRVQQFDSALTKFELAKRINPRFAPAYLNAGLSLWYQERYTDALKNLEQYVAMEPEKEKTLSVLRDIENLKRIIAEENR